MGCRPSRLEANHRPWKTLPTRSWMDSSLSATRCSTATHASEALGKLGTTRMQASHSMRTAALRTCTRPGLLTDGRRGPFHFVRTLMFPSAALWQTGCSPQQLVIEVFPRLVARNRLTEVDVSRDAVTRVSK